MTFEAGKPMPQIRYNVIPRFWRVVCGLKGDFGPDTINYTIEAECWNKAYSQALEDKEEIARLLGCKQDEVFIQSVTRIMTEADKCH